MLQIHIVKESVKVQRHFHFGINGRKTISRNNRIKYTFGQEINTLPDKFW